MKEVDYIVVGLGIAGLAICEQLESHNKSFIVYDLGNNASTTVSGGVFNPVVLKRFTAVWNAQEFNDTAKRFYHSLSEKLQCKLVEELPVLRIFNSVEEQNDWMVAGDKIGLSSFLSSEVIKNENPNITAPYNFGKVLGSGRIFPKQLLLEYRKYLQKKEQLLSEAFQYELISEENIGIQYKNVSAKKIIFCEGVAAVNNPFFKKQFLVGNKGEYLIVKAPKLKLEAILKGPMFIIPLGDDLYKVGATFSRDDYTYHSTEAGKKEIISKLNKMISCDFEVIEQMAGVRPTTKDRKPLLGVLTQDSPKVFFNGLGTRGIMMAPSLAMSLYKFLEDDVALPNEIDINRFR